MSTEKKYRFKTKAEFDATCERDPYGDYLAGSNYFTASMQKELFGRQYNGTPENLVMVKLNNYIFPYKVTPEMIVEITDQKQEQEHVPRLRLTKEEHYLIISIRKNAESNLTEGSLIEEIERLNDINVVLLNTIKNLKEENGALRSKIERTTTDGGNQPTASRDTTEHSNPSQDNLSAIRAIVDAFEQDLKEEISNNRRVGIVIAIPRSNRGERDEISEEMLRSIFGSPLG